MTGFGRGEATTDEFHIRVELQCVNKRGLEISVSYAREWVELESLLQEWVSRKVYRGKIQGTIQVVSRGLSRDQEALDVRATDRAWDQLERLANRYKVPFQPDLRTLVEWVKYSLEHRENPPLTKLLVALEEAVCTALDGVIAMREREGASLRQDFFDRVIELRGLLKQVRVLVPLGTVRYRDELWKRLQNLGLEINFDDERVLRELSLFAERSDVTEEMTRLDSHFEQMEDFLKETDPIGRKMEFLLQEIHREFNTMGSKTVEVSVSRLVIQAKQEIDRLREQVLNVE